jgi:lysylphosphatidylglycerol synthetase-like protein (DUF2156 family)
MKVRNVLAIAIVFTASVASLATLALSAAQLRPERAATAVVVDTAGVAQLTSLRTVIAQLSGDLQGAALQRSGFGSLVVLERTITDQETELEKDQIARHIELERRDRAMAVVMALAAFSAAACALGTILLAQAFHASSSARRLANQLGEAPLGQISENTIEKTALSRG